MGTTPPKPTPPSSWLRAKNDGPNGPRPTPTPPPPGGWRDEQAEARARKANAGRPLRLLELLGIVAAVTSGLPPLAPCAYCGAPLLPTPEFRCGNCGAPATAVDSNPEAGGEPLETR